MDQNIDLLLGRRLRGRRRLVGLTQHQLAVAVGVRFQQIQKYESGMNRISASRLWHFCQALDVPASYFFDGLPSVVGEGRKAAAGEVDLMDRPESIDLIRVFYKLDERPRRRLLDLAKSLGGSAEFT